jgi:cold shock CspA family protein
VGAGTVVEFDPHRGLGAVRSADGATYPFHCTRIADGSRSVPVGASVHFEVAPGPLGRWEAVEVAPD